MNETGEESMKESECEEIRHDLEHSLGPDSLLAESQNKEKAKKQKEHSK